MNAENAALDAISRLSDEPLSKEERRAFRRMAGESWAQRPVVVIDEGAGAHWGPRLVGSSGYWTTPSGKTIVRHPIAYGWRIVYHCSTRRVEVGRFWLARQRIKILRSQST